MLQRLFGIRLLDAPPFNKSIALLVGVGHYAHYGRLEAVQNDLNDLKEFLLLEGGFDQIYIAVNDVATPERVQQYMKNYFRKGLDKNDRLLFYYSGHGKDFGSSTGYMLFGNARPDDYVTGTLAISEFREWSRMVPARHMLFVFDCCASGVMIAKEADADSSTRLIETLSGNGSRAVITAGTADEKSWAVRDDATGRWNSVFTKALLDVLRSGRPADGGHSFMTVEQVFAQAKVNVARFAEAASKSLTPRMEVLEDTRFRGSFVFLNRFAGNVPWDPVYLDALKAKQADEIEYGKVSIGCDRCWAYIQIDGEDYGQTPREIVLPAGRRTLVLYKEGYQRLETTIEVPPNGGNPNGDFPKYSFKLKKR
jgi:uncharacterized caspase-like protein